MTDEEPIVLKKPNIPVKVKKIEEKEEDYIVIDTEELSKPPSAPPPEEPKTIDSKATKEAFANMIGFMSAMGLPEEEFPKKQKFYKQQALDLGLIDNLQLVIKEYMPDTEISPVMALAISLAIYGFVVYTDRQQTIKEYNLKHGITPKKKNIKVIPDKSKKQKPIPNNNIDTNTNKKEKENKNEGDNNV